MDRPTGHEDDNTTDRRDSVYVLRNSGLIRTQGAHLIGRTRSVDVHAWTELAYFDPRMAPSSARPEPEQLDIDDEAALARLAL